MNAAPNNNSNTNNTMKKTTKQPVEEDLTVLSDMSQVAPAPLNPESLLSFAIASDFHQGLTKRIVTTVPVRKPNKSSFIRTTSDPKSWQTFGIIEIKDAGAVYLVSPHVAAALQQENESMLMMANLVLAIDRCRNVFLWPLKVSNRENDWNTSARRAAEVAKDQWVRVRANLDAGYYDCQVAASQDGDAEWPEEDYETLLSIAFRGRVIMSSDHPVLKDLRGE